MRRNSNHRIRRLNVTTSKIVVGVDGSEHSARALQWCADHAAALDAEVVVAHVMEIPLYGGDAMWPAPLPGPSPEQCAEVRDEITRDWCKPLADAGVEHRVVLVEGSPPYALMQVADSEGADLVVTGRRGRGGFAELLLGSTSHALTHHCHRPLVIVP
jgi:nucleotide-binding universal stress UspA family protein